MKKRKIEIDGENDLVICGVLMLGDSVVMMLGDSVVMMLGVVACTCDPATLEAEFQNGVGLIPVGGNSPSIGGYIV